MIPRAPHTPGGGQGSCGLPAPPRCGHSLSSSCPLSGASRPEPLSAPSPPLPCTRPSRPLPLGFLEGEQLSWGRVRASGPWMPPASADARACCSPSAGQRGRPARVPRGLGGKVRQFTRCFAIVQTASVSCAAAGLPQGRAEAARGARFQREAPARSCGERSALRYEAHAGHEELAARSAGGGGDEASLPMKPRGAWAGLPHRGAAPRGTGLCEAGRHQPIIHQGRQGNTLKNDPREFCHRPRQYAGQALRNRDLAGSMKG